MPQILHSVTLRKHASVVLARLGPEDIMAKKHSTNGSPSDFGWLPKRDENFWQRLQVFPNAVTHSSTKADYERKALSQLEKLGRANLLLLSNQAGITYRAEADSAKQLAKRLFSSAGRPELIYLATFLRPRVSSVVEYFDNNASQFKGAALETEIEQLSRGDAETPKPLTKLIAIYKFSPERLEAIHYRYAWRRLPTLFEYTALAAILDKAPVALQNAMSDLVKSLNKLKQGEKYSFFGRSALSEHVSIFVLHRNYPPSVKPDYASDFRFQHDFGTLVFALDEERRILYVKVANRAIGKMIATWAGDTLGTSFVRPAATCSATTSPNRWSNRCWADTTSRMALISPRSHFATRSHPTIAAFPSPRFPLVKASGRISCG